MVKKKKIWIPLLIFALLTVGAPFIAFPNLEEKLNDQALALDSVSALEQTDLEWNGRNGYLTVPGNMNKDLAEAAAEDIEGITGVRDIKIIYDDSRMLEEEIIVPDKSPGSFVLEWTPEEKDIAGSLDEDTSEKVNDIFGVDGLDIDPDYNLSDDIIDKLEGIGDKIFDMLSEGRIEVDGDKIKISGTVADPDDYDSIIDELGGIDGVDIDIKKPEEEPQEDPIEVIEDIEFDNIEFDFAALTITPKAAAILDGVAEVLKENEEMHVDIIGHTDATGTMSNNQYLSIKRAEIVRDELIARGIDTSRMTVYGMGETVPLDTSRTEEADQMNRRVEIIAGGNN